MPNTKYKDSVFTLLFNDAKRLIELYNAIKGTDYPLDTNIIITTLENVLYMKRKNDIAFVIDGRFIVLFEHQSSLNENMPLRALIYIAREYEKIIDNSALYREKLIKIPSPEFYVLYNGSADYPKESTLKLSDAFMGVSTLPLMELIVKVININYAKSSDVLEKSRTLKDYSYFVHLVNEYKAEGSPLSATIHKAIKTCIEQDKLKEFLSLHGSEVENMLTMEWDDKTALQIRWEEGREEGIEIIAKRLLSTGHDVAFIADVTGLTKDKVLRL